MTAGSRSAGAVGQESEALGLRLLDIRAQRRLSLMARYFDVLLADMRDAADTEFLAVAMSPGTTPRIVRLWGKWPAGN